MFLSEPHKTRAEIIVLYILISKFLDSRQTNESEQNDSTHSPYLIFS